MEILSRSPSIRTKMKASIEDPPRRVGSIELHICGTQATNAQIVAFDACIAHPGSPADGYVVQIYD